MCCAYIGLPGGNIEWPIIRKVLVTDVLGYYVLQGRPSGM